MLPSFWVTKTKDGDWVDAGVGSTFHFSLFFIGKQNLRAIGVLEESVHSVATSRRRVLQQEGGIWSMHEQGVQRKNTSVPTVANIIFISM